MSERTTYFAEGEPEVYLPVAHYSLNQARHEAALAAEETVGSWGRARYTGKRNATLHDCADPWACETCVPEPAWCFETYEGTYRR